MRLSRHVKLNRKVSSVLWAALVLLAAPLTVMGCASQVSCSMPLLQHAALRIWQKKAYRFAILHYPIAFYHPLQVLHSLLP